MPDQKIENLLNLAMNALPHERAKSGNLNVGYDPTTRLWDVIVKYSGPESGLGGEGIQVIPLLGGYAVVTLPESEISAYSVREQIEFIEKPKRLYFETFEEREASCILPVQNGADGLTGKGILVGIVDSGVDYFHPDFRNEDGSTRILRLWDQSVAGNPPENYVSGTEYTKEEIEEILQIALEMRRRVKEQLKKLGGMEFYDVNFSYIDNETFEEHYVSVPEQSGGKLIPEGMCNTGQVYTVSNGKSGMIGVFRLESQMLQGSGKFERTGIGTDREAKESSNTAFSYLKANGKRISGTISTDNKDYIINYQDLQGIGMTGKLALPTLVALCSIALGKPALSSLVVLGEISISGTMIKVEELANTLQVCLDSGAKKVLLPATSFADMATVPPELMSSFQIIPYSSAEDAVFKALGVE